MPDFLNPKAQYRGNFSLENLIFNDNLQEFSNQIGIIVALETGGKIDSHEAYRRIKTLFKKLKKSNWINRRSPLIKTSMANLSYIRDSLTISGFY